MIYESLIGKIVSSKENNSRNIFKNILKEKNENYFIMSNSKKKREFKLIKNVINNSKDNDKNLTNNKYEQKKTKSNLKIEKNIKSEDNQNILIQNSLSNNTFKNYYDYSSYSKRLLYESTRKKFLSNSNLNLNSNKTNHKKTFSLDKTNLIEKNRRKQNLTINSPELTKTINQNKKKSSPSKKYYLITSTYNNKNNEISSSNSKNTLSFSSSPFSYSSSDNKNLKSISKEKKGKNEPLSFFNLSNPKINEIEEIKNYQTKSFNKKQTKKLIKYDNNYKKNEENKLSDKTKTTSINSGSNNISDNISSFRMSKTSFKNSNLSLPNSSRNNKKIVNDNINLKNAIANTELNDTKKYKKNQINICTVSNSEKKLLIPEYSVKKPLIQDSYLSFNKKYTLNYDTFITLPKLKFILKRNSKNKFQKILDDIILTSNEIGKDLTKFNSRNNKRSKTFSKNFNTFDIENNQELKLMKNTLIDSNLLTQNYFHHLRCETVKYDNRLIDALKNSNEPFVVDIIKSRSKIRNRTLQLKRKNFIKSSQYKINDYRTITKILNEEKLEMNQCKNSIEKNFHIINFLNNNVDFPQKKVFEYLNNNYHTINVSEKIRKIREYRRKKNKTIT